jgi:uncharacterized protein YcbK (DUF882 family)
MPPVHRLPPPPHSRRQFLRAAGLAAATLVPIGAACARSLERRSVSFVHTHTGERLSAVYFQDGAYQPASLERINYLLRDFRTEDIHVIDPGLLDVLYELRTRIDRDDPFEVISGYRSPHTNAELRSHSHGVAEHSMHIEGKAIDIRVAGYSTRKLRDVALGMQRGGVGFYASSDFVHLDTGRVRFW